MEEHQETTSQQTENTTEKATANKEQLQLTELIEIVSSLP